MVAARSRARGRGWAGGPLRQAPVVDAHHVLGPLAGREVRALLEAREPVVGVFGPDDQERRPFFADGERTGRLQVEPLHREPARISFVHGPFRCAVSSRPQRPYQFLRQELAALYLEDLDGLLAPEQPRREQGLDRSVVRRGGRQRLDRLLVLPEGQRRRAVVGFSQKEYAQEPALLPEHRERAL